MRLESYSSSLHKEAMKILLSSRQMSLDLLSDLPKKGCIVLYRGEPVAAGFLRRIEGRYAMMDSFISSPGFDKDVRNQALNMVTEKLVEVARKGKISGLMAFSAEEGLINRGLSMGFKELPYKFILLNTKDEVCLS